jgi:hypothetical protein
VRPYLLAAAVALTAATATATPAAAADCAATAPTPRASGDVVIGEGTFACATPYAAMTVTACLESLHPAGAVGWVTESCSTADGAGTTVTADVWACVQGGPALVRAVAFGTNEAGVYAYAAGTPVFVLGVANCGP